MIIAFKEDKHIQLATHLLCYISSCHLLPQVNHILNHTSGLHNALAGISEEDPTLFCDFDKCLESIAKVAPETVPGREQFYHYLSYGWLCGGIIEVPIHIHLLLFFFF